MRIRSMIFLAATLLACSAAHGADKLKGFYSGSGGLSQEVHRVLLVEFADDGTVILQQTWEGKSPQVWHARWIQEGKEVRIVFDAVKDQVGVDPLVCTFKHGMLTPTSWDTKALGVLGPPPLAPFGGKNVRQGSVATCQSLNSRDPTQNCATWDSRRK